MSEKKLEKARNELQETYNYWVNQLNDELKGSDYSNPYYVWIPDNWFDSEKRIMIVGEEGSGEWGAGKAYGWKKGVDPWKINDFKNITDYNRIKMLKMIDEDKLSEEEKVLCNKTGGVFWQRFQKIYELGKPCIYNNLDKIHRIKDGCVLNDSERKKLHGTDIKVLAKEIEISKPTIVLFCGYYKRKSALKAELPTVVYDKFFTKVDGKYNCDMPKDKIYTACEGGITYILSYHPQYSSWLKNYEKNLIDLIKDML